MAIRVSPLGNGSLNRKYRYLYEPFLVKAWNDTTSTATKIYVDVGVQNNLAYSGNQIVWHFKYGEFDINVANNSIEIDLAGIAREFTNHDVYKAGNIENMRSNKFTASTFWRTVGCQDYFSFNIYTDSNESNKINVATLIYIMGSRPYFDMNFTEDSSTSLYFTEFEKYGITQGEQIKFFPGYPAPVVVPWTNPINPRADIPQLDFTIFGNKEDGKCIEEFIIWKSRYGGWMAWGFELSVRKEIGAYEGSFVTDQFEYSEDNNVSENIIPVNYTGITSSYSLTLKSLNLTAIQLMAVSGIRHSPAIYLLKNDDSGDVELMRLTSVTAPVDSKISGGDFSVGLKSISQSTQLTK